MQRKGEGSGSLHPKASSRRKGAESSLLSMGELHASRLTLSPPGLAIWKEVLGIGPGSCAVVASRLDIDPFCSLGGRISPAGWVGISWAVNAAGGVPGDTVTFMCSGFDSTGTCARPWRKNRSARRCSGLATSTFKASIEAGRAKLKHCDVLVISSGDGGM